MTGDELLCPTCGTQVGAGVTGAELRSHYEARRRAALDRMVEIADESGMYDLHPQYGRPGHSFTSTELHIESTEQGPNDETANLEQQHVDDEFKKLGLFTAKERAQYAQQRQGTPNDAVDVTYSNTAEKPTTTAPQQPHNSRACTCLFCWSENRQLRAEIENLQRTVRAHEATVKTLRDALNIGTSVCDRRNEPQCGCCETIRDINTLFGTQTG